MLKSPKARPRRRVPGAGTAAQHRPVARRRPAPLGIRHPRELATRDPFCCTRRLCAHTGQAPGPVRARHLHGGHRLHARRRTRAVVGLHRPAQAALRPGLTGAGCGADAAAAPSANWRLLRAAFRRLSRPRDAGNTAPSSPAACAPQRHSHDLLESAPSPPASPRTSLAAHRLAATEVCPPSLRQAPRIGAGTACWFWLAGAGAADSRRRALNRLPPVRQDFLRSVSRHLRRRRQRAVPAHRPARTAARAVAPARRAVQLVALHHSQHEAERRLAEPEPPLSHARPALRLRAAAVVSKGRPRRLQPNAGPAQRARDKHAQQRTPAPPVAHGPGRRGPARRPPGAHRGAPRLRQPEADLHAGHRGAAGSARRMAALSGAPRGASPPICGCCAPRCSTPCRAQGYRAERHTLQRGIESMFPPSHANSGFAPLF